MAKPSRRLVEGVALVRIRQPGPSTPARPAGSNSPRFGRATGSRHRTTRREWLRHPNRQSSTRWSRQRSRSHEETAPGWRPSTVVAFGVLPLGPFVTDTPVTASHGIRCQEIVRLVITGMGP